MSLITKLSELKKFNDVLRKNILFGTNEPVPEGIVDNPILIKKDSLIEQLSELKKLNDVLKNNIIFNTNEPLPEGIFEEAETEPEEPIG